MEMMMDFGTRKPAASPSGQLPGAAGDLIKDTTTAGFAKDVIEASKSALVLVDFWAPWCGPCKQLTPTIEKVVKSYAGKVRLVKINIDEHPAVAGQLRVQSIPTVYAFRDGRPLDGFMGAQTESAVKAFVDRLLGDDAGDGLAEALAEAEKAYTANDLQTAAEIYAAILQQEPQEHQALAGLARCYLKSGDAARAEQTLALVPPDKRETAPVKAVHAAIELSKQAANAGDASAHAAKVAAEPANHQARIDYALALAADGKKDAAVEQLIEAIRRDRNWNEEAARKQLVKFFEAWGFKDPAAIEGRKRLSSVLFR
jgi:putative thioredoxin